MKVIFNVQVDFRKRVLVHCLAVGCVEPIHQPLSQRSTVEEFSKVDVLGVWYYRGTSLINTPPPVGPYSRPTPQNPMVVLGGGGAFL